MTNMMRISASDCLLVEGVRYEVVFAGAAGVEMRSLDQKRQSVVRTHEELWKLYFDDRLQIERSVSVRLPERLSRVITRDPDSFPEKDQAEGWRRYEYVMLCERYFEPRPSTGRPRASRTIEGYARIATICSWMRRRERARLKGVPQLAIGLEFVSGSGLRQWHRNWVNAGRSVSVLIPQNAAKGRVSEIPESIRLLVADTIDRFWLTPARVPLRLAYSHIVSDVREQHPDIAPPSESTVRRWVEQNIDGYTKTLRREGQKKADQEYRAVAPGPRTIRPLQNVEFDHTLLDVMVVKDAVLAAEGKGAGLARPWLTAAICRTTRMIFGFHIGFERPSWVSIMNTMHMGVLPKEHLLEGLGIENPWPVQGVPEVIICDNGREFHSNSLQAASAHLGFEIRYAPVRKPNLKGRIERFLGEVARDFLAFVPGKTFHSVAARGDCKPEGNPYESLSRLQEQFLVWLVDVRHGSPHRGLAGMAPLQKWEAVKSYGVRLPPKASDLTAYLGQVVDRAIQRQGVEYMGLFYQSKELSVLKKGNSDSKRKWSVKIDPYDLSHVFVLDEDAGKWLFVPSVDPDLTDALTAAEYRLVVAEARRRTKRGQKVLADTLLRARKRLLEEGLAMGAGKRDVTAADREWLERSANDPAVFVGEADDERGAENLRRQARQEEARRKNPPKSSSAAYRARKGEDDGADEGTPSEDRETPGDVADPTPPDHRRRKRNQGEL